jgi:hypothetical protein
MSASANSRPRTAERFPRWSSTGNAGTRPHARPASRSSPRSSATCILIGAESNPTSHTSGRNQLAHAPRSPAPTSSPRSNRHR